MRGPAQPEQRRAGRNSQQPTWWGKGQGSVKGKYGGKGKGKNKKGGSGKQQGGRDDEVEAAALAATPSQKRRWRAKKVSDSWKAKASAGGPASCSPEGVATAEARERRVRTPTSSPEHFRRREPPREE